ncbi:MAG: hypothetical protein RBS55_10395 [Bacteroidales bacterium]|nr:hypothetical protein [Bacteroidales bacterium]
MLCVILRIVSLLFTFLFFFLSVDNKVFAQQFAPSGGDTYTSPGLFTWVCPADVTCIKVECWGGGGRGGNQTIPGAGGGGGGGAFARGSAITVVPGTTYYIKVGNGSSTTLPGGDSWFGPTSQPTDAVTLAKGGSSEADNGASGALGGSAAGCIGDKKYSGGQGGRALFGYSGGGGGGAGTTGPGGNANVQFAGAGTPLNGGNGGAGLAVFGNGFNGFTCGGGGSGEKRDLTDYSSGNGANGQVVISFISAFQITPYNGSFCEGDIVNIGLSGSETGVSYQLLLDAVATGAPVSGTGNAISFGDQGLVGTYTVIATLDSSACTRMMNGYVVIHPAPEVSLTGPTPACTGSTGNIYITQAGMSDYAWTVSAGGTVTAGGTITDHTITITWNTAGSQTVGVNYTDGNGCSAATPAIFYVTVIQQSGDPASAAATPATICNGQSATLTLTGGGGGAGTVIRWYTGSCGGTLVGTGNNLVVSPIVTTTYYGRYEDQPPCGNSACAQVTDTGNQKSANPESATAAPASVCAGQSA